MEFKMIKSQLVELVIPAAPGSLRKFTFETQNFLRLKQIVSLEVLTDLDASVSPQGNTPLTGAQLITGYITFYGKNPEPTVDSGTGKATYSDGEWVQQIPLSTLHRLNNGTDPFVFGLLNMVPRNIVWEKSYVEFFADLGNETSACVLFNVGYSGNEGDN